MKRGTRDLASGLLALALLSPACAPADPPASTPSGAPDLVGAHAPVAHAIDSLRALGHYDEAAGLAARRHRSLVADRRTPAWRIADAARASSALQRIRLLPVEGRLALARADAVTPRIDSLLRAGEPLAALALVEAQLAARQRWLGAGHEETAASQSALARVLLARGEAARAGELDRQALRTRRRVLGERHPDVAESLDQLALDLKTAGGSRAESMALYRAALALRQELLGIDSPEALATLQRIGNMHRLMQQPDSALAVFGMVLDQARRSARLDDEQAASTLFSMAMTVTPRGEYARAEPWLREAVEHARRVGPAGEASLARMLGAHGLVLRHQGRHARAESVLVESAALFETLRRRARLGWSRTFLYPLVSYDLLAAVQLERGHGPEAWLSMECGLGRALLEDLAASGAVDTVGWWNHALARVQEALEEDAAIVGWLVVRPGAATEEYPFWSYCVRKRGPVVWRRVDAPAGGTRVPADASLDHLRRELVRAASWPLRVEDNSAVKRLARAAYDLRVAPLESALVGVRRLVVVSPDLLHGAPVEAMQDSSGRFVGDRFVVSYAPSALLYAKSRATERSRRPPGRWRALLVGDPERGPGAKRNAYPALAAARQEVERLARSLPAPTVLLGADVNSARLDAMAQSGELGNYELIHFATHASVDQTWLEESALVLGGDPGAGGAPDRLTTSDLTTRWRLDADVVTLAACQTVIGPASRTEGFLGLQQALLATGARHLVVSAWRVDDRATALLVDRFYRGLLADRRGAGGAAEALAEARRLVRNWRAPDGSRPFAHPVYWAGFVLVDGGLAGIRPPHAPPPTISR